jgi:pimeloyl-ACP methyl ester carboxylesterase
VIPRLQAAGLNVTSVQNPLTTLPEAVASAERVLARQDGRTVLAGHSFSGIIVTEAGVHPNVSALVYVAARAPDAGEDYTALAKTFPTPPATAGIVFDGDEGRLSEAAFLRDFAGDLPEAKAKILYAVQKEADRKQCPRRFRRSPRRLRSRLRLSQLRLINSTPTSCSRSRIWRLREGCAVCSRFLAASVRLPSSAAAMKKRRCRSSMASSISPRHAPQLTKYFERAP